VHPITRTAHVSAQAGTGAKTQTMADKTSRTSDGNLVNVGNFDDDGANVNRNEPRNVNDNLGVSFSRSVAQPRLLRGWVFCVFYPSTELTSNLDDLF
jgi:hypothetical protein